MAILKIIADCSCKLYIDQELVFELEANTLHKEEIQTGVYLVDIVSQLGTNSFDLIVEDERQQFLKRIDFKISNTNSVNSEKAFRNNADIFFYNGLALVKESGLYGYINSNYEWVVKPEFSKAEHFIKETAIVEKIFNGITKICIIDTEGKNIIGGWFDQILFMDRIKTVLRRDQEIIVYNSQKNIIEELYDVCGQIYENEPIPVITKPYYSSVTPKAGYINKQGDVLLPFIYEQVSNFTESGYAEVQRYGIKRFINKEGKICILNTIEDIEKRNKNFLLLDEQFEWCGKLEIPTPNSIFLSECYRIAVLKEGKWGYYGLKEDSMHVNHFYEMIPCEYDTPFSDSKYEYVVMKKGRSMSVVNLVNAKYDYGDKTGQFIYGEIGEVLFSIECDELYAFNNALLKPVVGFYDIEYKKIKYELTSFVVKKNGKYGIVKNNGHYLTQLEYDDIYIEDENAVRSHEFTDDICIAEKDGQKEIINLKGEILSSFSAKHIFKIVNHWVVKPNYSDKYFLFDSNNKILNPVSFDEITYGNNIVETRNDECTVSEHDDYIIKDNNYYGVFDKDAKLVIECKYSNISHITHTTDVSGWPIDGYEVVQNNKHGVISAAGQIIVPCQYDEIKVVPVEGERGAVGYFSILNNKYGYYTEKGEMILNCIYDNIIPATEHNTEFIVFKNGKCALLNDKNKLVTDFIYDEIFDEEDYSLFWYLEDRRSTYKVRQGNNIGIINDLGQILVECKYPFLRRLYTFTFDKKYRYEVGKNKSHGIIIEGGIVEVDPIFDRISDLGEEEYVVEKNGKKALMSWDKKMLTDYIYDDFAIHGDRDHNLKGYSIKSNGLWGFLNEQYIVVIDCLYNSIDPIFDEINKDKILAFKVSNSLGKFGVLDIQGSILVPLNYDDIYCKHTTRHQFVCYSNKIDKDKCDNNYEPFTAFDLHEKKNYHLDSTHSWQIYDELWKNIRDGFM